MDTEKGYYKGIMVGFAIGTIIWCFSWAFLIGKIDKVHEQELNYIIEKHHTNNCEYLLEGSDCE